MKFVLSEYWASAVRRDRGAKIILCAGVSAPQSIRLMASTVNPLLIRHFTNIAYDNRTCRRQPSAQTAASHHSYSVE